MAQSSCSQIIRAELPDLTETETKIAKYVLENYEEVLQLNVSELAQRAGVSDASIVRFSKRLGYKGFIDFKMNMARDVIPEEKQFDPVLEQGDGTDIACRKIFGSAIDVLNRTITLLNFETVHKAAVYILNAGKVAIFATGGSLVVALDAQHKLMKIGIETIVYPDVDMQLMASTILGKDDVAICISFSGSNYNSNACMQHAKNNGARCIGILSQKNSPLTKLTDVVIYSAYDETIFQSESTSTRIAQLAIIDCIVGEIALQDYDKFNRAISDTREAVSANKY